MTFQQLKKLRADHLKAVHNVVFYPYQEVISDSILVALLHNLNITKNSTPEEVEQLKQAELAYEVSRQAGKTFCVGLTTEFILTWVAYIYKRPVRVGIFAPQIDQARLSYEITRRALRPIKGLIEYNIEQQEIVREEENSKRLVLPDGSSCLVAPINTVSKIEGLTLDLIFIDEAQLALDKILTHSIFPMGKTTNAPRVYIGKAGTQKCRFYDLSKIGKTYKAYFDLVAEQRKQTYEITGDAMHLIYEKSVKEDIAKLGIDEDEIQREYYGKWQIGTGQFVTLEELEGISIDRKLTNLDNTHDCYVGIDTAKQPDSTVVTVIRWNKELGKKELINWLELRGENYKNQYEIIIDFLSRYKVIAVAIDSTGQGQFMPDWFKEDTEWADENSGLFEIKFTQQSKDGMYRNLKVVIKDFLTTIPKASTKLSERFEQQMLDLQQQYKGQYLSVSHPDDPKAHDDYCFVAGTLIATIDGQKPIETIKVGDYVLTRKGYKKVLRTGNRYADTITRFGITGTPDHPFITKGGVKKFIDLHESDIIYIWNEKRLCIEESSIIDTQIPNTDNLKFTTGLTPKISKHLWHFIGKYGLIVREIYRKAILFITKMITHLTTTYLTLNVCTEANTNQCTLLHQPELQKHERALKKLKRQQLNGIVVKQAKSGIDSMLTRAFSKTLINANETNKGVLSKVYNIEVADSHEYFANNILVHNCDSWALAEWAFAKWNEVNNVSIDVVNISEKERKPKRDNLGKVVEYWPGLDEYEE